MGCILCACTDPWGAGRFALLRRTMRLDVLVDGKDIGHKMSL